MVAEMRACAGMPWAVVIQSWSPDAMYRSPPYRDVGAAISVAARLRHMTDPYGGAAYPLIAISPAFPWLIDQIPELPLWRSAERSLLRRGVSTVWAYSPHIVASLS